MTTLTDYVLAGVTVWLARLLFQSREAQAARTYWTAALVALALGAALGGTYHGFAPVLPVSAQNLLWKSTILTVGIATFAMVVGSAIGTTTGRLQRLIHVFAAAKLIVYSVWMVGHDDYVYVIADSAITMAIVGALHAWTALRAADPASIWMLSGVAVSVLAAGVQAGGRGLHQHFGPNDLYHVIQIVAMWLLVRGARQLRDCQASSGKS